MDEPRSTVEAPPPPPPDIAALEARSRMVVRDLDARFGAVHAVKGITLPLVDRSVTAIIGPSGCGKSTFLRCLNRMHETIPGARAEGEVLLDGQDIYAPGVDPVRVRRHIGMVFQRPTAFPTLSIADNAGAGLAVAGRGDGSREEIIEEALRHSALWDEVKHRLDDSAVELSGGQQQRLCIARALAMRPAVLLLDEPTASLDPISTERVEELIYRLSAEMTIAIVTHSMQQAARVSERTAFLLNGELVEFSPTQELFTRPRDERTEAYITGRFG